MNLILKDSQYIKGQEKNDWHKTSLSCQAVDKLNSNLCDIDFFSFNNKTNSLSEEIIWYKIDNTRISHSNAVVNKATFFTSHYIGFYSTIINNETVNIKIEPRFGNAIFNYLLSYAYGIYLPKGYSSSSNDKSDSLWLIAVMWKATLEKAITKSQIPKEYQKQTKNIDTFKGQLNIAKHIQHNLFDKSKFYCNYRKLTIDTLINQTIRYTYKLLEKKGYANILKDIAEYDQMLQSFGVQNKQISIQSIRNIRYSKLNIYYKKVIELSTLIIKNESKSSSLMSNSNDSFSYFLDIAELWENYLLKILQKNLPSFNIYSPNEKGGISLFDDGSREIRPDIIIEQNGKVVAVLDAKYKWYNKIGKYANIDNSVSRDDLYQMTTYLYHYGKDNEKIVGLFVSPINQSEEVPKALRNNKNHKIGVMNLNIEQFDKELDKEDKFSTQEIKEEETKFINIIKGLLNEPI
jgi:5-methylcytosine-specific restriction enzyme subunit McrC